MSRVRISAYMGESSLSNSVEEKGRVFKVSAIRVQIYTNIIYKSYTNNIQRQICERYSLPNSQRFDLIEPSVGMKESFSDVLDQADPID